MADPVTTNRNFAIPTRGSDIGTWDTPLNANFGQLDTIVGGIASISTTGGDTTLNATQLASGTISVSGALTSTARLIFPAVQGWWSIENITTGNFVVQVIAGTGSQVIAMPPGEITDIQINGNVAKFRNLGRVGSFLDIASSSIPAWIINCTIAPYLYCNGTAFSSATYPALARILGSSLLPDTRGRARFSLNDGTSRITTGISGINGNLLTGEGGAEGVTLTTTQIPSNVHANTLTDPGHNHATNALQNNTGASTGGGGFSTPAAGFAAAVIANTTGITITNAAAGGGGVHNNMPPTYIGGITLIRAG